MSQSIVGNACICAHPLWENHLPFPCDIKDDITFMQPLAQGPNRIGLNVWIFQPWIHSKNILGVIPVRCMRFKNIMRAILNFLHDFFYEGNVFLKNGLWWINIAVISAVERVNVLTWRNMQRILDKTRFSSPPYNYTQQIQVQWEW